jgi:transposase InsO family protein
VNCYPFIEAEKAGRRNVKRACALLKVSRAAFYSHLSGPSKRAREDAGLTGQIQEVHEESRGRYGAPRIHAELRRRDRRHSRKRVARLMRAAGIAGKTPKRWRKTTIAAPAAAARADRIRRDFTADAAKVNARWCGDITYIGTWEGWLYLATVTGHRLPPGRRLRPGRSPAHRAGRWCAGQRGRRAGPGSRCDLPQR